MEFILENLGKIGFDWKLGLFNLINFFVLFWLLKKYLFAPMMKVINERHEKAQEAVENFKKAQTEVNMAEQNAQKIIDEARKNSNEIISSAKQDADSMTEKMKDKAKGEIELLVSQARKNIAIEKKQMREEIKCEVVDLVVDTTEKVLGEKIDSKKDAELIKLTVTNRQ